VGATAEGPGGATAFVGVKGVMLEVRAGGGVPVGSRGAREGAQPRGCWGRGPIIGGTIVRTGRRDQGKGPPGFFWVYIYIHIYTCIYI